jgi:hypothetical protein
MLVCDSSVTATKGREEIMNIFAKVAKNEPEPTTETDPVEGLVALLDSEFPGTLPEERSSELLSAIAPEALRALRRLRRRRILSAAAQLPLQSLSDGIATAVGSLRAELAKHADTVRRIEELKVSESRLMDSPDGDPLAATNVRGEIQSLESWVAKSSPLLAAVEKCCDRVDDVSRAMLGPAWHQSFRDAIFCRLGAYEPRNPSISSRPILTRAEAVLAVADKAAAQLAGLMEGKFRTVTGGAGERVNILSVSFRMPFDNQEK